jgi:MerR family Zn(II)-responsive transcriptional regulator of zntA
LTFKPLEGVRVPKERRRRLAGMRIGELAKAVGVNTSAIRYYEQIGLLQPVTRTTSGYRDYTEDDERRLRLVVQARMLSVPLGEARDFVDLAVDGRCNPARTELLSVLRRRVAETRHQIRELKALQRELENMCAHLADGASQASGSPNESCTCLDTPDVFPPRGKGESNEGLDQKEGRT